MESIINLPAFITAAVLLNLTPGNDTMYILGRGIAQGKGAGILSALGISTGALVHICAAALGLANVLATSDSALMVIKLAGAGYLIFLGSKSLFTRAEQAIGDSGSAVSARTLYTQGILTNILNPKVGLFFLAFLPQFIAPGVEPGPMPFLILGGIFLCTSTLWCVGIGWFSSVATRSLRNNPRTGVIMNQLSGVVFVCLGLKILAS